MLYGPSVSATNASWLLAGFPLKMSWTLFISVAKVLVNVEAIVLGRPALHNPRQDEEVKVVA